MKIKILIITMAFGLAFGACQKQKSDKILHCDKNFCLKDTIIIAGNNLNQSGANCKKMDGVNVRNIQAEHHVKLGDSISINLDAIGLNTAVTGKIMFAISMAATTVEINTLMEYDICGASAESLTPMPAKLSFLPPIKGTFNFTFINIYGDFSKVSITVD